MTKGCIGENNLGLLEARPGTGCPATVPALVSAENRDRMVLYRTLVEQNNMPPGDLARVQAAFAKAHRDKAPAGASVQDDRSEERRVGKEWRGGWWPDCGESKDGQSEREGCRE